MFRRLAEGFKSPHPDFIASQQKIFNTDDNRIPSDTSGLLGFGDAIKTPTIYNKIYTSDSTEYSKKYQPHAVEYPDDIFKQPQNDKLTQMSQHCASSTFEDLYAEKQANPGSIGCGWLYTPPVNNSSIPVRDVGALGTSKGPFGAFNPPSHTNWFFNLDHAQQRRLLDRCKALKTCANVGKPEFKDCGFCTSKNQGVPINRNGQSKYPLTPLGSCSDTIITDPGSCPPIQRESLIRQHDVCDPINGRLEKECLRQQVIKAGCTDNGALAIALSGSQPFSRTLLETVNLHNRFTPNPLNINLFSTGAITVENALAEARKIVGNSQQPENTGLGMAARDLCYRRGAADAYDECNEMTDASKPPYTIKCLQQFFLKMGGNATARLYPRDSNITNYNTRFGTLGDIKQYWKTKFVHATGKDTFIDYDTQSNALQDMHGIKPEDQIKRAPYVQGIEIFWFLPTVGPSNPLGISGFLKRTIHTDINNINQGSSTIPQLSGLGYGAMLQLTDVRTSDDFSTRFSVTVDDGFTIIVNHPAIKDEEAMSIAFRTVDAPGHFQNLGLQGPTLYTSGALTTFRGKMPNIMRLYHEDAGGGWTSFLFNSTPKIESNAFSLTCERRAPFLAYEVSTPRGNTTRPPRFEELRNPGIFSKFYGMNGGLINLDYHTRTDEINAVPGKKSFIRLNSANSRIDLPSIAFQSWTTITFPLRFISMPIKETLLCLKTGPYYYNLIAYPINGYTSKIFIECNVGNGFKSYDTGYRLDLNIWYLFRINNLGTGFSIQCASIDYWISNKGNIGGLNIDKGSNKIWQTNGLWATGQACTIMFGTSGFMGWPSYYSSGAFQYDLAWLHFFDGEVNSDDMYREAKADWIYTQYPNSFDNYNN